MPFTHAKHFSQKKQIVMRIRRIKIFLDFYAITLKTIQLIKFMENSLWQLIIIESLQTELRGHSNNTWYSVGRGRFAKVSHHFFFVFQPQNLMYFEVKSSFWEPNEGERGVRKMPKSCHILFEWPLFGVIQIIRHTQRGEGSDNVFCNKKSR